MQQECAENRSILNCFARDEDKLQNTEVSPAVMQLKDKIDRLSVRLTLCHNENHVLRCNLDLVKDIMRREAGEQSQETSETERKRGRDAILKLPAQIRGLQTQLKQLEEAKTPPDSPSEESVRKQLNEERKAFWRMELERRQAREGVMREVNPIARETVELSKKLIDENARFRNLNKKVHTLRLELQNRRHKGEESEHLVRSFHEMEHKLSETQKEICKLRERMRDVYPEVKSRNDKLAEEISELKNQIKRIKEKKKNNSDVIKSLNRKRKEMKDLFGSEKWHLDGLKDDLKQAGDSFKDLTNIHDHIENLTWEKSEMVNEFENLIQNVLSHNQENDRSSLFLSKSDQDSNMALSSTGTEKKIENDAGDTEVNEQETRVEEKLRDCNRPEVEKLMIECAKYRALVEAATTENDRLSYFTKMLKIRLRDITKKGFETKRKLSEKSEEKKNLLDKTPKTPNSLKRSDEEIYFNLRDYIREQREENEFLRAFLKKIVESKIQDTHLYRTFMDDSKVLYENALQQVKDVSTVLNLKRNRE